MFFVFYLYVFRIFCVFLQKKRDKYKKYKKKYESQKYKIYKKYESTIGKIQKKYKNTNCIFGRNGKIQKKYKNTKYIFFVFYLHFLSIFLYFYKKIRKKRLKIRMQLLKNTKYKKNTNQQFQKYKIQKKNTNPKVQKYKIQRKDKFKNKPESQPRVHFWKSGTKIQKKYKTNQLYFPNPAVLILYFWVVFVSYFFCSFKYWQKTLL